MDWVTAADAAAIQAPALRAYVKRFVRRGFEMERTMRSFGLSVEDERAQRKRVARVGELKARLAGLGATIRNDGKSVAWGAISPACERCRTGVRSVSSFISLACNRSCWFCFNANQCDFELYRAAKKDWRGELTRRAHELGGLDYVALTGGEPLLYPDETLEFVRFARTINPQMHVRLYTSGCNLDDALIDELARCGLDEIRLSVKLEDGPRARNDLYAAMRRSVDRIACVMVEMPVVPGTKRDMTTLLKDLEACGIFGINLLELCFPLHNHSEYRRRGLALEANPFRIPYSYGYAGALPVAQSEQLALELMCEFAAAGTRLNMHYCSLENKNTAQIYGQNHGGALDVAPYRFSERSFFYEVIRVFDEVGPIVDALEECGCAYALDEEGTMVAFDPAALEVLCARDGQLMARTKLFCASAVIERDAEGTERFCEVGLHVLGPDDLAQRAGAHADAPVACASGSASAPAGAHAGGGR